MKTINRAFTIILILPFALHAQLGLGIFKKHTRVKLAPTNQSYRLEGEEVELQEGYFTENERWVVFSDRAANDTYKSPGSDMHLKPLGFMDACYVIGKKEGYLELVKYDAKLLKDPSKGKIDKKSADYFGWVQQSHLLLWRNALKENNSKFYLKAITCFKNQEVFSILAKAAVQDSLLLFGSPGLKGTVGRCAVEELFYIFKQSDDGKQYLLGRSTQLSGENARESISGWVSKDLVKVWGGRSFFTVNDSLRQMAATTDYPGGIPFFTDSARGGGTDPAHENPFHFFGRSTATSNILENIFPVQGYTEHDDSTVWIKTGVLADVLDRSDNEVINVLGKKIRYQDYKKIISDQTKTNIIFVVDGGRDNGKYLANLPTIVQNLELFFDTSHVFKNFRYGAVVYKDGLGGSCRQKTLLPTPDYQAMIQFFYERQMEINSCNNDTVAQAVFPAVLEATKLLMPYRGQNNIVVLIGAAGNNMENDGYTDVVSHLSYAGARLLVFQTHSIPHPSYNDFVIQAKNLVLRSALNVSELKKEKLVDLNDVLDNPQFSLVAGDSGVYSLDYPKNSMVQGYVMFPSKGQSMPPIFLGSGLDSLMHKMYADNRRTAYSLTQYFSTIGMRSTRILQPYRSFYPGYDSSYLPIGFLRSVSFSSQPFYLPAWASYRHNLPDSAKSIQFGLLVSGEEYEQLLHTLFNISDVVSNDTLNRRLIYKHLCNVVRRYLLQKKIMIGEGVGQLSFAEVLEWLTGYRSVNPSWNSRELNMIRNEENMPMGDVLSFFNACKQKALWLQDNANNNNIRFFNNGRPYYWITAEHLP